MSEHIKEIKVLVYNENAVCEGCGNNDFHCNFFWKSHGCEHGADKVFHGDDESGVNDVWCHVCEGHVNIVHKDDYNEEDFNNEY